jgi:hypothetical protein
MKKLPIRKNQVMTEQRVDGHSYLPQAVQDHRVLPVLLVSQERKVQQVSKVLLARLVQKVTGVTQDYKVPRASKVPRDHKASKARLVLLAQLVQWVPKVRLVLRDNLP